MKVSHQIEIAAGRHYYQSLVTLQRNGRCDLDLVAGIVNMKSDELHVLELDEQYTALLHPWITRQRTEPCWPWP